jgi:hypothetical protein
MSALQVVEVGHAGDVFGVEHLQALILSFNLGPGWCTVVYVRENIRRSWASASASPWLA